MTAGQLTYFPSSTCVGGDAAEGACAMISLRFLSLPIGKLWPKKAPALPCASRLDD